jgi:peptide deformylase
VKSNESIFGLTSQVSLPPGEVRWVLQAPDVLLSEPCGDAHPDSREVRQLAADLIATMRVSPGCVGLAANQIGVPTRVFCLDVTDHPKTDTCHGLMVLCNPEIVAASRNQKAREGCMSVPDWTGDVKRATRIIVQGQLPGSGEVIEITTDAFEARAIQHEVDHLNGLLFVDRVDSARGIHPRRVYL